jgi:hypothetical protein
MLQFFRKYQKIFFIGITIVVVVSFCFFGTYSTFLPSGDRSDEEVGKGIGGRSIRAHEFTTLQHLLESSVVDRSSKEGLPNLLNPGVIERDFLATGLALMLVKPYFATLKPELDSRVKRIHLFQPYLGLEGIWSIFSPEMSEHYQMLQARSDQATLESFALMSRLYLDERALPPPALLKQVLMMQQQKKGQEVDPQLEHIDLNLFGFKSLEEWFGPRFVPLVTAFILNAAELASLKGYEVSWDEVRGDLLQNIYKGYAQVTRRESLTAEEVHHYYLSKIRSLGVDEKTVLHAWKQVLLFHRLIEEGGGEALMDPLFYRQFDEFAADTVEADLYQLPPSLRFPDLLTMLQYQLYLEGISVEGVALRKTGALPLKLASLEQIEKKAPYLVEIPTELQWKSVTLDELERGISLREMESFELTDPVWLSLTQMFPVLGKGNETTLERLESLAKIPQEKRSAVDKQAHGMLLRERPERVQSALDLAPLHTLSWGVRTGADFVGTLGTRETSDLLARLKNAPEEQLISYQDGERFYEITILKRSSEKRLITGDAAERDGTLSRALSQILDKRSSQEEFADLIHTLKGQAPNYAPHEARFYSLMRLAQERQRSSLTPVSLVEDSHPCCEEWRLEKSRKEWERKEVTPIPKEVLFALAPSTWSQLYREAGGGWVFCQMQEKKGVKTPPFASVEKGHQILSEDALRNLMGALVQRLEEIDLLSYGAP